MTKTPAGIASHYATMSTLQIPQHWSPEQALAVYDFLNELSHCIWNRYEVQLLELMRLELYGNDPLQLDLFDPDDTIPF
jgi:hypothetical protein